MADALEKIEIRNAGTVKGMGGLVKLPFHPALLGRLLRLVWLMRLKVTGHTDFFCVLFFHLALQKILFVTDTERTSHITFPAYF